jgi:hypothetical protein
MKKVLNLQIKIKKEYNAVVSGIEEKQSHELL